MTMTPEEIKNHIGEVWEDDGGNAYTLIAVLREQIAERIIYLDDADNRVDQITVEGWLSGGTLPQSLRKAKPRMVKAPGWVVWHTYYTQHETMPSYFFTEADARKEAASLVDYDGMEGVGIQAPGTDEMEVVKGFE